MGTRVDPRAIVGLRLAEAGMAVVVAVAALVAVLVAGSITVPGPCPLPVPPIVLRTVSGSGELVFLTAYSTYSYADGQPQAPASDLRFELAEYHPGDDYLGPGTMILQGPLLSLNQTGDLQFHDMAAEGEFSPGNDFFILLNPPPATVQLRILDPNGSAIAWNMITGCI